MFKNSETDKIKKEVELFFEKMTFPVSVQVSLDQDSVNIDLKSDDPRILIGERGIVLASIQKLLKIILQKKLDQQFYFNIDINEYRKKKAQHLKEMAKQVADEVSLNKQDQELEPMSSYERRIVHMELAERDDIETESVGEGMGRRLVVKAK